MAYYWLTPPSRAVFFISVLLAVLALLVRYAHVAIPVVSNHSFETLLIVAIGRQLVQRLLDEHTASVDRPVHDRECSASGTKRTPLDASLMSALPLKADMFSVEIDVRYVPIAVMVAAVDNSGAKALRLPECREVHSPLPTSGPHGRR
jgi:hypothetical protein